MWGGQQEAPERVLMQLHSAELDRSFAKVGVMDPYVVVTVDGKLVHRTGAAMWAHKRPSWDVSCAVRSEELPGSITVSVWNQNRMRKDVFCGSVTVPITDDMGKLHQKEFTLTKRSQITGAIRLSLAVSGQAQGPLLDSMKSSLGAELDHIATWLEEGGAATADTDGSQGLTRMRSLALAENAMSEQQSEDLDVQLGQNQELGEHPTLLSPKNGQVNEIKASPTKLPVEFRQQSPWKPQPVKADEPCIMPQGSMLSEAASAVEATGETTKAVEESAEVAKVMLQEAEVDGGIPTPLAGHWECTSTFGLEEFLTNAGLGSFQRRLAMAARWPSWDFKVDQDRIKFINHSAMGDLHEEILLDGSNYTWKDGRSNLLKCHAKWTKTADGGCLTISRSHAQAAYHEERRVSGDTLTFTLFSQDGTTWGRVFKHSP